MQLRGGSIVGLLTFQIGAALYKVGASALACCSVFLWIWRPSTITGLAVFTLQAGRRKSFVDPNLDNNVSQWS